MYLHQKLVHGYILKDLLMAHIVRNSGSLIAGMMAQFFRNAGSKRTRFSIISLADYSNPYS
jgi:hypothetical protein